MLFLRLLLTAAALLPPVNAVNKGNFKTCEQARFCKNHRNVKPEKGYTLSSPLAVKGSKVIGGISNGEADELTIEISFIASNQVARVRIVEGPHLKPRWENPDVLMPFELCSEPTVETTSTSSTVKCGGSATVSISHSPFALSLVDNLGNTLISSNARGLMHFDQQQLRKAHVDAVEQKASGSDDGREIIDWGEDGKPIYADDGDDEEGEEEEEGEEKKETAEQPAEEHHESWAERFGDHTDTKPRGPMSVGLDISFHAAQQVFGIPEHATSMALKSTNGENGGYSEPYRLYNLDVFEYELDVPMALYGAIPFMIGHAVNDQGSQTSGAFWHNPSETFVDIQNGVSGGKDTYWVSETGIIDLFLLAGPAPAQIFSQYAKLTGTTQLPPLFALGYHQCRWNYKNEEDVFNVDGKFEEHDFPYDVLWLDIEHTNGKRYFTWDNAQFPNPAEMQKKLASRGRKMVTIIDPHIKRDSSYHVHKLATDLGYYIKNKHGSDFDGWCWPGSSSYLDFTQKHIREWWGNLFQYETYKGSTPSLYTWNDMNEPSVFNGPEVSMHKDAKNIEGVEHREWHNLYGFYFHMATASGHVARDPEHNTRPFVLTRSFFAGSQRIGAMWTGDNAAEWSHLAAATPMLLTQGIAGFAFSGADVGGFFGNPDPELLVRWYQAGAFQPFFRAHAHLDTKRREPWMFGDDVLRMTRNAVLSRYAILPYIYTLFYIASTEGMPVMRPLWVHYPTDVKTFTMDDQFLLGEDLLVKPVTAAGQTTSTVYLPEGIWFDYVTGASLQGGQEHSVASPLDKIPVFQRGGSIIPRKNRVRRCSKLMAHDPYSLYVAPSAAGEASGLLYLDEEDSFNYRDGQYRIRKFSYKQTESGATLTSSSVLDKGNRQYERPNVVERVVISGMKQEPTIIRIKDGAELTFYYSSAQQQVTVRKPWVKVVDDWILEFVF